MTEQLPGASGAFTRALFAAFDTEGRYAPLIGRVRDIGVSELPADWLPWLVYDAGLEDIIGYRPSLLDVLADGPEWLALRGTPEGIDLGIRWVQPFGVAQDAPDGRHDWWEFQLHFDAPADLATLQRLVAIARLSKAAEDDLFRVFVKDADRRPVRMDEHRADDGWMDDYSGSARWDGGPLVAFGFHDVRLFDAGRTGFGGIDVEFSSFADRDDDVRHDESLFEERPTELSFATQERDGIVLPGARGDTWAPTWTDAPWRASPPRFGLVPESTHLDAVAYGTHDDDTWRPAWTSETWAKNNGRSGATAP